MDSILVAVDGSKHSEKVVDYAASLAKALSAKILLVNIPPDLSIPEGYKQYAKVERSEPENYFEEVSEGILRDLGDRIRKSKVQYEPVTGGGPVAKSILDIAKMRRVSLIVVGIYGLHRVAKVRALGSNARRILESSDIPVVAVP